MAHPRCVGWGEIGLDYHYDNSPRDIQQRVFIRQLRQAIRLAKPLTIHTREADDDTLRILKEEVPKDHRVSHLILPSLDQSNLLYTFKRYIFIVSLTRRNLVKNSWTTSQIFILE